MFLKNIHYFSILMVLTLTASCKKAPNYSVIPSIQFQSISIVSNFTQQVDTVIMTIRYQDGDGNIGHTPFITAYDYFVQTEKKTDGSFTIVTDTLLILDSRLPLLSPTIGPIDGTIQYKSPFQANGGAITEIAYRDTLRFNIRIVDRAGNYSNWVTTDEIVIWKDFPPPQ